MSWREFLFFFLFFSFLFFSFLRLFQGSFPFVTIELGGALGRFLFDHDVSSVPHGGSLL